MPRAFLFVMDSVGIGGAPDAAAFGDEGADTFGHIAGACAAGKADEGRAGPLRTPNLDALGIRAASAHSTGRAKETGAGCWAVGREVSNGKDTPSGHWELAGVPVPFDWGYFPKEVPAFSPDLMAELERLADLPGILGQKHSNGMSIISEYADEHISLGKPIVYTSADSVFQIAAHEDHFGLERLYQVCLIARELLYPLNIGRVIARPFIGESGAWKRTPNRRDYAIAPPEPTLCDRVVAAGGRTIAIGKIGDIFAHKGISEVRKGQDDMDLFDKAVEAVDDARDGDFVFANFVEFDSLYGHLRDVAGYARALEAFDARLPEVLSRLREGDLLIITADHGNDPTWCGNDHTREQVPVLCAGPGVADKAIGTVGFADVGETLAAHLSLAPGSHGKGVHVTDWRSYPKLELHLHLEGAAPPPFVRRLATEKGLDLTGVFDDAGRYISNDFTSFLRTYERVSTVFTTPEDYRLLMEAVLAECAANGVIYAEVFLSPTSFGYDLGRWTDYLAAIEEGADRAEATHGVIARFIPVAIRHHGPDQAIVGANTMMAAPRGRMTGFGIAGDERLHVPRDFAPAFQAMAEAGFRLTAHAGEFGGAESVRAALDDLNVERIGHGVRSAEDPDLLVRLAAEGQVLETCPGSNVSLGVFPDLASHSIAALLNAGVNCTVSTDDPPFFHTNMTSEYEGLEATFAMGEAQFARFARTAVQAAFCEQDIKAKLSAHLDKEGVPDA